MQLSPEQIVDLRARVLAGEQLDLETLRAVVEYRRGERRAAAEASRSKPKRTTKRRAAMSDAELDADLDSFLNHSNQKGVNGNGSGS